MKKKFLRKNKIIKLLSLGMLVGVPLVFTSCSSISQASLDSSFLSNNGSNFAQGFSLKDIAKQALKTDAGQNSFLSFIAGQLAWNWFLSVSQRDNEYKSLVDSQKNLVDQQWNNLVDEYKQKYEGDWALKLQQEVLDSNGGNVNTWKQIQLNNWAKNELQSKLFTNNYIGILTDANGTINSSPTAEVISTALKNTTTSSTTYPQYGFSKNIVPLVNENTDPYYSDFQKFIYDNYISLENPYVAVSSLWKYSTPTNGITSIYSTANSSSSSSAESSDEESESSSSTSDSSGSYAFPYFDNSNATNQTMGTLDKYSDFINKVKTTPNFVTDADTGIKQIPAETSDDSSTYQLLKNSNNFSDSNIHMGFSAASSYMYGILGTSNSSGSQNDVNSIQITQIANISKTITPDTTSTDELDKITKEFVSSSSIFTSANTKQLQLNKDYVSKLINPNGLLKSLAQKDLYSVDAFLPTLTNGSSSSGSSGTTTSNVLNDFIFIRDIDGVRAVAIDGDAFIKKATTLDDKQKRSGNILIYHYLMNKGGYSNFNVDILSELKSFYNNNLSWLIVKYAISNSSSKMFDFNALSSDITSSKDMLDKLTNYISLSSYVSNPTIYANKMIDTKSSYSANYGIDAPKNGLAAPWVYDNLTESDANYYRLNKNITFNNVLTAAKSEQIKKETSSTYVKDYEKLRTNYLSLIDTYFNNLILTTQTSDFEGFKYSQYILSNSTLINQTLESYASGDTSSTMSTYFQNQLISNYLNLNVTNNSFFDISNYAFKDDNYKDYLNSGLANYFFNSSFDNQTNKWTEYTLNNSATTSDFKITKDNLNNYRKSLWIDSLLDQDNLNSTTYSSLLNLLYTTKYLMDNDFSNFLEYMQNKISYGTDTYFVWSTYYTNLVNSANYKSDTSQITQSSMLNLDTSFQFIANVNNNYSSAYVGNNVETNGVNQNTNNSVFNDISNYYNVVSKKIGFYGIQSSSSNSLPEAVSNSLFTNASKYVFGSKTEGVLYAYGSKTELIDYIKNLSTIDSINSLITSLRNKLSNVTANFGELLDSSKSLKQKKDGLVSIIENNTTDNMYKSISADSGKYLTDTNISGDAIPAYTYGTNDNEYYATYVIQVNHDSFKNFSTFLSTFGSQNTDIAYDVFFNLLIEAATDNNLQSMALDSFVYNNKINVYDGRLNKQLGYKWVKNWKDITPSSK